MPDITEKLVQVTLVVLAGTAMGWCLSPALLCAADGLMCSWP